MDREQKQIHPHTNGVSPSSLLRKKSFLIAAGTIPVAALLLFGVFRFALPRYHYAEGKRRLEEDNYNEAFKHFMACWDYRDTEEILRDFVVFTPSTCEQITWDGLRKHTEMISEGMSTYCYNEHGQLRSGNVPYTQYDDSGNPLRSVCYSREGEEVSCYEYAYNSSGVCIYRGIYIEGKLSGEYRYDDRAHTTECIKYTQTGEIERQYTVENTHSAYEDGIYVTEGIAWEAAGLGYDSGDDCKYYRNGNLKSAVEYGEDGSVSAKVKCYRNGNLKSAVDYRKDGSVSVKTKYYRSGGVKSMAEYREDGTVSRKVKYYRNGVIASNVVYNDNGKAHSVTKNTKRSHNRGIYYYRNDQRDSSGEVTVERSWYDAYGRNTRRTTVEKVCGEGFPKSLFCEKEKVTYVREFADDQREVRYMPDYGAEKNK